MFFSSLFFIEGFMKRFFSLFFVLGGLLFSSASLQASAESLESKMTLVIDPSLVRNAFYIEKENGERLGRAYSKIFSSSPQYKLMDNDGNLVSRSKARFFTINNWWRTTFDLYDREDQKIGELRQKFQFLGATTSLDFHALNGEKLARSRMNFWGLKIKVLDPNNKDHVYALIKRPLFSSTGNWSVEIFESEVFGTEQGQIHPHMLYTAVLFHMDRNSFSPTAATIRGLSSEDMEEELLSSRELMQETVAKYRVELEAYAAELGDVEPSEEDFSFIADYSFEDEKVEEETEQFERWMSLLDSEELTEGQKAALIEMLSFKLSQAQ